MPPCRLHPLRAARDLRPVPGGRNREKTRPDACRHRAVGLAVNPPFSPTTLYHLIYPASAMAGTSKLLCA
ncbi:hypothetical protein BST61_g764 [Cercospora zeina]